ncbi:Odorant-Hypothetical protein protein [Nesidiocoris tenuis]|uniref:Uncharacterized protein n=1 Tax=Nesidiocoris tenuis TaxID=355587 RepID=A0ABN7B8W1_9HEMI|nr:Odorant-Hypothetical protein protein [Nesidiocoris tenuis]
MEIIFKILLLGLLALQCHAAVTKEFRNQVLAARDKCKKEHKISDEALNEWVKNSKLPDGEAGKCYLACYMKEIGYMENGKLDYAQFEESNAKKWTDKEMLSKANAVDRTCVQDVKTEGKDDCTIAAEFVACKMREVKKIGLKLSRIPQSDPKPK